MANLLDSIVKGYTTGMNNQLNAQKAYIDSYITGINARNAVNQEARTKDQYWNYTNPLNMSNLSVIIPQNQTQADFYGDPNVRRQQLAIANQVLGNQYGMSQTEGSLLPTYQRIRENDVKTSDQNAIYNYDQSKANRAMQADNNATAAYKAKASLGQAKDINNLRSVQIQQELNDINNSNPTGTATDGTTNTDVSTTIMLQNGGKTPTGMFGTDGRLNFTGTTTTPASGLPSNPSNAQKNPIGTQVQQKYNPFSGLTMAQLQQKALELTGDPTAQSVKTGIGTNVRQFVPNFLLSADTIGADAGRIQAIDSLRQAIEAEQNRLRMADENNRVAMIEQARTTSYNQSIGAK